MIKVRNKTAGGEGARRWTRLALDGDGHARRAEGG